MKRSLYPVIMISFTAVMLLLSACGSNSKPAAPSADGAKQWSAAPEMNIDPSKTYEANFRTTKGDFSVELYAKDAPITVNNFVFLAREKFYDGVKFHRIIESFMIQTGDPQGTGRGGPGYQIKDEPGKRMPYDPGVVAMARTNKPNSAGSQFFICTGEDCGTFLNSNPVYVIFGKVKDGMETIKDIAASPVEFGEGMDNVPSKPTETVTINSIEIVEH